MNRSSVIRSADAVYASITRVTPRRPKLSLVVIGDHGTYVRSINLLSKAAPYADEFINDPAMPGVVGVYDASVKWDDFIEDIEAAMDEYERLDLCLDGTSLYRQGSWWRKKDS